MLPKQEEFINSYLFDVGSIDYIDKNIHDLIEYDGIESCIEALSEYKGELLHKASILHELKEDLLKYNNIRKMLERF